MATRAASELADRITHTRFGFRWPADQSAGACRDYLGDGNSTLTCDYWVHRCQSTQLGGGWFADYVLLGDDSVGTMERVSWVAESPKAPREWRPFFRSLVEALAKAGATITRNNDSTYAVFQQPDRSISIELYFDFQRPSIRRLTVDCLSARLKEAAHRGELSSDASEFDPTYLPNPTAGRLAAELTTTWPAMGRALYRPDSARVSDLPVIVSTLDSAAQLESGDVRADIALFAVDRWSDWVAQQLNDRDTLSVRRFNETLRPYGAQLTPANGGWCYNGAVAESLAIRAARSVWANQAFLEWMSNGFLQRCDDEVNEGKSFRVIEGGERFLREHRGSAIEAEVELAIAQAHETIWCLAKMSTHDTPYYTSDDFQQIRAEGPSHRTEAITLYQRYLAARPDSPMASGIRRRLIRLRNSIDTGYYKYWYPGD
jgi:hypothetical protein